MLEKLKDFDRKLFIGINSLHNNFFDVIMYWASDKLFWIPFYAFLLAVIIRHFKKKSVVVLLHVALLITLSDQIASNLVKNSVKRLRPSHEPALKSIIHLSSAGAGGQYGFVSSHASNSFALFAFISLILPRAYNPLKIVLFFWATLVAYSRVYVGVHYPGDVFIGGLIGAMLGVFIGWLYTFIQAKIYKNNTAVKTII